MKKSLLLPMVALALSGCGGTILHQSTHDYVRFIDGLDNQPIGPAYQLDLYRQGLGVEIKPTKTEHAMYEHIPVATGAMTPRSARTQSIHTSTIISPTPMKASRCRIAHIPSSARIKESIMFISGIGQNSLRITLTTILTAAFSMLRFYRPIISFRSVASRI